MRKRNLLAGLLLLPLGATAGLFWWLQKAKPKPTFNPEALIKANIAFWKSADGRMMRHQPVFGVRIYHTLPTIEYNSRPDTVTVVPVNLVNDVATQRKYGTLIGYDNRKASPDADLYSKLMKIIPGVRIINIQEDHPWVGTDSFKTFVLLSSIKYVYAYGLLPNNYPPVNLHTRVKEICPDLEEYLQSDMLEAPHEGACISADDVRYIRKNVIPFTTQIREYLDKHTIENLLEEEPNLL